MDEVTTRKVVVLGYGAAGYSNVREIDAALDEALDAAREAFYERFPGLTVQIEEG